MIGLAMIVRNEAANIRRCLESAKPHIQHWTIVDTGSTDGTQEIIRQTLKDVPGKLWQRRWRDFAHNRTELMQKARGTADWLLLLDADMVVHIPDPIPELDLDCYEGRILNSSDDYTLPFLVSGSKPWKYVGVAHSYLACDDPYTEAVMPGLGVDDYSSTGVEKLRRDLDALQAEHARNPLDARTAFYLAQTYGNLDMIPEATAMYRARAHLPGWEEETYVAKQRLGSLLGENVGIEEAIPVLLDAWRYRPHRAEALRVIAALATSVADKIPYPDDRLFVDRRHYKTRPSGLTPDKVSAVIVTRGNVDLQPILDTLPYDDVVVWDNSVREDLKIAGRYRALAECKHNVVYFQDDDVLFTAHDALLAAYEPGKIVANMDQPWIDACGYHDMVLLGAGSIADRDMFWPVIDLYAAEHGYDADYLYEPDFIVGTMLPWKRVDLGYVAREFADDEDRLYRQPWQAEAKERVRSRARELMRT